MAQFLKGSVVMNKTVFLILLLAFIPLEARQVAVIGCGHIGLVMAAVFSKSSHTVLCVDIDQGRIAKLKNKQLPIYEPNLEQLLFERIDQNIFFFNTVREAICADIFYICVPTPSDAHGECDCSFLYAAFQDVLQECVRQDEQKIICIKSTVPPGTMRQLQNQLLRQGNNQIHLVYNPEFVREGSALRDVYGITPIVLGADSLEAIEKVEEFYQDLLGDNLTYIKTNFETAELIKYAWNTFSAIRIAYVNELALLSRQFGANIASVVQGLALSEQLLPTGMIKPGPGYGGACLPKEALLLSNVMRGGKISSSLAHQAGASNRNHINRLIQDIFAQLGSEPAQKTVAVLGLSFKAQTSDIRDAPSIAVLQALIEEGVSIRAYDPKAIDSMKVLFPHVHYFNSPYEAVCGADCIVVLTEWEEIRALDLEHMASLCNTKIMVDARNVYDPALLKKYGFMYINMGRV